MFSGEVKNNAVLFTQDGQIAVVATTSSIGYGVPAGNVGRNFPNTGFDHVTLRFSSASVDCFINGDTSIGLRNISNSTFLLC
jgi:hypothetical protein